MEEEKVGHEDLVLDIVAFRRWTNRRFIFRSGVNLLTGVSGGGKTSILDAIAYAFTGIASCPYTNNDKRKCEVEVCYRGIRVHRKKAPVRLDVWWTEKVNGDDENSKETDHHHHLEDQVAQQFLDLMFGKHFMDSSYMKQKQKISFLTCTSQERLAYLEQLACGQTDVEQVRKRVAEEIKRRELTFRDACSRADALIEVVRLNPVPEEPRCDRVEKHPERDVATVRQELNNYIEEICRTTETVETEIQECQSLCAARDRYVTERNGLQYRLELLQQDENLLGPDVDELRRESLDQDIQNLVDSNRQLQTEIDSCQRDLQRLEKEETERKLVVRRISELASERETVLRDMVDEKTRQGWSRDMVEHKARLARQQKWVVLRDSVAYISQDEVKEKCEKSKKKCEKLEDDIREFHAHNLKVRAFREREEQLARVRVCPECKTELIVDPTSMELARFCDNSSACLDIPSGRMTTLRPETDLESIQDELATTCFRHHEMIAHLTHYDHTMQQLQDECEEPKTLDEMDELGVKIERLTYMLGLQNVLDHDLVRIEKQLQDLTKPIDQQQQTHHQLHAGGNSDDYLDDAIESISKMSLEENEITKRQLAMVENQTLLQIGHERLVKSQVECRNLITKLARKHEIVSMKSNLVGELESARARLNAVHEMFRRSDDNDNSATAADFWKESFWDDWEARLFDRLPYLEDQLKSSYDALRMLDKYVTEKTEYDRRLGVYDRYLEEKGRSEFEGTALARAKKFLDLLCESQSEMVALMLGQINSLFQQYVDSFFPDDPMTVFLDTFKNSKQKSSVARPQINISIQFKSIKDCDVSMLSGGEFDRLQLALNLAFTETTRSPILILDECMASLDQESYDMVISNLRTDHHRIVIVVAHQVSTGQFDSTHHI